MKKLITNYLFDPSVRKVTFEDYSSISLSSVLLITNTTDNLIIYNFADPLGGGTVSGNILTLLYNTTAMSPSDSLQVYYDDGSNSLTDTELRKDPVKVEIVSYDECSIETVAGSTGLPFYQNQDGLQVVQDLSVENVLGVQSLVNNGRMKIESGSQEFIYSNKYYGLNNEISVDCSGMASASIQFAGTWAGTHTFEVTTNGGDWVAISGTAVNGTTVIGTTTTNNIFRFNVVGLSRIRVRFNAYTSGTAIVTFRLSAALNTPMANYAIMLGSQSQLLTQRATTFEANTYDTNLAAVLGTVSVLNPQADPPKVAPVAPTLPATYVSNALGNTPQRLPMLRTQIAGSERIPFAQQPNTYEMKTIDDTQNQWLEKIWFELKVVNQMLSYGKNVTPPNGWDEIK